MKVKKKSYKIKDKAYALKNSFFETHLKTPPLPHSEFTKSESARLRRKKFKIICSQCNSSYCSPSIWIPTESSLFGLIKKPAYEKFSVSIKCNDCGNTWVHAFDLEQVSKAMKAL